ncbi:MAG TPA: biotin/lipoyl-binding protein, partial [Candidatus Paceibacterota bacterium]
MSALLRIFANPFIALGGAALIALAAVGIAWQMSATPSIGQYATATIAPITSAGGENSDLSFQVSGQIISVPVTIGQHVEKGASLVALDRAQLAAQRAAAAANLEAAQAKLASVQSGTRPEQLAVNQTSVTQAQAALLDAVRSAYINADDAIHNKVDQFLIN